MICDNAAANVPLEGNNNILHIIVIYWFTRLNNLNKRRGINSTYFWITCWNQIHYRLETWGLCCHSRACLQSSPTGRSRTWHVSTCKTIFYLATVSDTSFPLGRTDSTSPYTFTQNKYSSDEACWVTHLHSLGICNEWREETKRCKRGTTYELHDLQDEGKFGGEKTVKWEDWGMWELYV